MDVGSILLIILGVIVLFVILLFNSLVRKKHAVSASWAGIETQLQRRYDLIPNLVETVKGYARHEQESGYVPNFCSDSPVVEGSLE